MSRRFFLRLAAGLGLAQMLPAIPLYKPRPTLTIDPLAKPIGEMIRMMRRAKA